MTQDTEAKGAPYDIENDDLDTLFTAFVTGHLSAAAALRGLMTQYCKPKCRNRKKIRTMLDAVGAAMGGRTQ